MPQLPPVTRPASLAHKGSECPRRKQFEDDDQRRQAMTLTVNQPLSTKAKARGLEPLGKKFVLPGCSTGHRGEDEGRGDRDEQAPGQGADDIGGLPRAAIGKDDAEQVADIRGERRTTAGKRTPASGATAIVMTTGSDTRPRRRWEAEDVRLPGQTDPGAVDPRVERATQDGIRVLGESDRPIESTAAAMRLRMANMSISPKDLALARGPPTGPWSRVLLIAPRRSTNQRGDDRRRVVKSTSGHRSNGKGPVRARLSTWRRWCT